MRNVKSIVLFVIMTFALNNNTKAQYVTLTDSNFVTWLSQYTSIAPCFNGNQLDTTCPALLNLHKTYISTYGLDIRNLDV